MDISDFTFGITLIIFVLFLLGGLVICLAFFGSDSNDPITTKDEILRKREF